MMNEQRPIRLLIVDDHLLVRDGIKLLVSNFDNLEVVGTAADGAEAITACTQHQPDVILMDIVMPGVDGPTATAQIRAEFPNIQVIALTSYMEEELIQQAIKAGAIGFMLKNASAEQLEEAIRAAYQGRPSFDPAAMLVFMQGADQSPPVGSDLTERERDVLELMVAGKTNKEIASQLTLSQGTVRVYVSQILSKLGVSNRTEAVSLALRSGFLS